MKRVKLREYRGGRTQQEMARLYGVSQQAWEKWENGKALPQFPLMKRIEDDSGLLMEDIFSDALIRDVKQNE